MGRGAGPSDSLLLAPLVCTLSPGRARPSNRQLVGRRGCSKIVRQSSCRCGGRRDRGCYRAPEAESHLEGVIAAYL